MLSPDSPIKTASDDRLGRATFARALTHSLMSFSGEESFVVGIHGKWGTGKSSILNLLTEQIEKENEKKPETETLHPMRFNPWNFSDQNQLIFQFLRQFRAHLQGNKKEYKQLLASLDDYTEALAPPLELLPYGKLFSSGLKFGVKGAQKVFGVSKDVDALFEQVASKAKHLKRRTVVIVDDIDRLTAAETRQIFQLVKLTARFPYVIYILAFDRDAVSESLKEIGVKSGAEYLEKIVQVAFDIPPISETVLTSLIGTSIHELMEKYKPAHFDPTRYGNMFHAGLRSTFRSLRDIRRFLNGLEFAFGMMGSELNAVDFIGIEAIRTFYPAIFDVIRNNKDLFSGHVDTILHRLGSEKYKANVDQLLLATGELTEELRDLLIELFPKLSFAYGSTRYDSEWETEWEKSYRIVATRYFDSYFSLVLAESEVSVQEVTHFIKASSNQSQLINELKAWKQKDKLQNGIEIARHRFDEIPRENLGHVFRALLVAAELADEKGIMLAGKIPEYWSLRWALFDVLGAVSSERRVPTVRGAFSESSSLKTMLNVIALIEQSKKEDVSKYVEFGSEDIKELKALCVGRIRSVAQTDPMILSNPALPSILHVWKEWGGSAEEINVFLTERIKADSDFLSFMDTFIYQTHSTAGRIITTQNRLSMKALSNWMDLSVAFARINSLHADRCSLNEQQIIEVLRAEIVRFQSKGLTPEQFDANRMFD